MRDIFAILCILFILLMLVCSSTAHSQEISVIEQSLGCRLEVQKSKTLSGRFIWKPKGEHFPGNAVIVAPRFYYPVPPRIDLFRPDFKHIERARLKSDGLCAGNPECLFAATFLTRHNGGWYKRRIGSIIVRIKSRKKQGLESRCYLINRPHRRAEFVP